MIVTVARDEALRLRLAAALRDSQWGTSLTAVDSVGEAQELLAGASVPRVLIVGPSIGLGGATDLVTAASALRRPPPVLLVGDAGTELLRAAMRAGVRDVLPLDFSAAELLRALEEAGVGTDGPVPMPGRTIAVFSTKGGVGTSVVASNLAARIAQGTSAPTMLVDLDLASADQAIMHGLTPKWTIQDLADGSIGVDAESLDQVLMDLRGSGARLLPGPLDPALAETITAAHVAGVVAAVRAVAPVAVLDTSSGFDDRTLAALDASERVVVVSSLDVAALRSLTVSLETLRRLGVADDRIVLAMNRADSKSGLLVSDVERAAGRVVDVEIPSTRAVPRSVNEGGPLAVTSPRSPVVAAIDQLVELVLHGAEDLDPRSARSSRSGGLFSWGRGSSPSSSSDGATTTADTTEADGRSHVDVSPPTTSEPAGPASHGEVVPMRRDTEGSGRPNVVRRRVVQDQDRAASDADATLRPQLDELPPPKLVQDDGSDDQPQQRRRR